MNELALFAGAGGGILGSHLLGWRTICAVERDAYAAQVLAQRQTDGSLPAFPIWSDVCSFDGRRWRGLVDVVSGGFPCQDISAAGNGTGINGSRSGLWREMARIISEVRPALVYLENSPLLVGRGLALVLGELAEMGYDAQWCIVSASDVGAPHKRDRTWLMAYANEIVWGGCRWGSRAKYCSDTDLANTGGEYGKGIIKGRSHAQVRCRSIERSIGPCRDGVRRWPIEPGMGRVAHGVAHRMDRIKALGNGQVPRVAAAAFVQLSAQDD
ncbi:DNA cytosine methyltransferase [Pseudomonas sp. GM74]|uniref:DNA cytosine methyltransferase n=1 Tax=Pseudomonas sp. GM74 TaxID=1144336 RepID=UPI0009D9C3B4|nr:DNA cytosine methyltransferase [Pseudomonas sp. GM74]